MKDLITKYLVNNWNNSPCNAYITKAFFELTRQNAAYLFGHLQISILEQYLRQ